MSTLLTSLSGDGGEFLSSHIFFKVNITLQHPHLQYTVLFIITLQTESWYFEDFLYLSHTISQSLNQRLIKVLRWHVCVKPAIRETAEVITRDTLCD